MGFFWLICCDRRFAWIFNRTRHFSVVVSAVSILDLTATVHRDPLLDRAHGIGIGLFNISRQCRVGIDNAPPIQFVLPCITGIFGGGQDAIDNLMGRHIGIFGTD